MPHPSESVPGCLVAGALGGSLHLVGQSSGRWPRHLERVDDLCRGRTARPGGEGCCDGRGGGKGPSGWKFGMVSRVLVGLTSFFEKKGDPKIFSNYVLFRFIHICFFF